MTTANVATKRKSLYINEVAKLVGVTTKTVRHYHKIGLLPEPTRSASDYRLYSGWDLWRLRTICELRRLGLPLDRIRTVLEAPAPADALRSTLATQLDEISTQLVELAERKERIQTLMSQEHLNVDLVNGQPDLYTDEILAKYADLIPEDMDESLIQFERDIEQVLATFPEHDARADVFPQGMAYIEEHPEQYQQLMHDYNQTWAKVNEIETLDSESKVTISNLADALVERNQQILQAQQALAQPSAEADTDSPTEAIFGDMLDEKMKARFTPVQLCFFECMFAAADAMRKEQ